MVDQKAIAAAIGDVIAQRDVLAAEVDRTRHEFIASDGIRDCAHILKMVPSAYGGEYPHYCCQSEKAIKHRTSRVILAGIGRQS